MSQIEKSGDGGQKAIEAQMLQFISSMVAVDSNSSNESLGTTLQKYLTSARVAQIDTILQSFYSFSGENCWKPVNTWINDLEELARISAWNDDEIFYAAKKSLTGSATEWLKLRGDLQSWAELKIALKESFSFTIDQQQMTKNLKKERPDNNEPLQRYMFRMWRMTNQAGIPEETALKLVVEGMPGKPRNKKSFQDCRTFDDLRTVLPIYELKRRERGWICLKVFIMAAICVAMIFVISFLTFSHK
ncbi:hypothetical protein TSAR_009868 [Trichomalopsis sarcophagae]|uniref:Retrotransposon gag domain-containing protein n=1 Tax=Trichomalopsis sarcophagae TaxID=543379 RepID=A0A232FK03_9HYME|nr:hypothetical protein TSAR_009868 [Trichomalopsis sarcophagae]